MRARRKPVALRKKVKVKLEEMFIVGVLVNVVIPTDWVSQILKTAQSSDSQMIETRDERKGAQWSWR